MSTTPSPQVSINVAVREVGREPLDPSTRRGVLAGVDQIDSPVVGSRRAVARVTFPFRMSTVRSLCSDA